MEKKFIIVVWLFLIVISLNGQNTTLDLIKLIKTKEYKNTTDIFEFVRFVPLETKPETITKASTTVVTKDNIFMFSNAQGCILKFDREGKFIGKIGRQGRGPGEFVSQFNLTLFRCFNNYIYLFDEMSFRIMKYSIDGSSYQEIPLEEKTGFIFSDMLDENCFLISTTSPYINKNQSVVFPDLLSYNSKGKLIYKFPLNSNSKNQNNLMLPSVFYHFNNTVYYKSPYCDTVFKILGPTKRTVVYTLSPGNKRMESNETKGAIVVYGLLETQKYLLIDFILNGNKRAVYDKSSGTFYQINSIEEPNNIDRSAFLWPKPLMLVESTVPKEYITFIEPSVLKRLNINDLKIQSAYIKLELIKLQNVIEENDNPIIVFMREKE